MIARRLRPIGWVAGVAGAALCFYLVSLQVAAERTALESTERRIAVTERQIRQLETEFSARASLRQLESYNNEVLALSAPKVQQYLTNEVQLASYSPADGADIGKPVPSTALASVQSMPSPAPAAASRPSFKAAVVSDAKSEGAPVIPAMKRPPLIQTVAMIQPMEAPTSSSLTGNRPKPAARPTDSRKVGVLDASSLGDIARQAAKEAKARTP